MNTAAPKTFLEFALDAVWQAGRITLGYFQAGVPVDRKADNTPVTIADREAEQRLRTLINQYWPDHGIVGEEFGRSSAASQYTWLIDPIDGTKSFVSGVPLYANLLALLDGERALLGVIHLPALNETVYAVRGEGCYWNGRRARVSQVERLEDAVLLMSGLEGFGDKTAAWQRLCEETYIQRSWGDAYGYTLVATGRAEIMLDPIVALWDCAPLQVILEEAGGTYTDWHGNATIHAGEGIATNGRLFEQVLRTIQQV